MLMSSSFTPRGGAISEIGIQKKSCATAAVLLEFILCILVVGLGLIHAIKIKREALWLV
jgi:hypothetical protein